MARSRRTTPVFGITKVRSDAVWKARAARSLRRHAKVLLEGRLDEFPLAGKRWELVDPWTSAKDGKRWWNSADPAIWRK